MRRNGLAHAALAALLVLGGLSAAGTFPASATGSAAGPATSTRSAEPAADGLVTAMQRDLGLTRTQAVARLAAEKSAAALDPGARRTAGAAYAGSWFDAPSGRLTVA